MSARTPQMYYGFGFGSDTFLVQQISQISYAHFRSARPHDHCRYLVACFAIVSTASICCDASAQDRSYGRSVVATQYGIVATSQVSASQAGARVLEQGGSAIDAAIAANAVLNVTEPTSNGMGGDLFAIYWEAKTGKLYGLNASGWAPQGADDRASAREGHYGDAAGRDRFRHRAGRGGWMGEAA